MKPNIVYCLVSLAEHLITPLLISLTEIQDQALAYQANCNRSKEKLIKSQRNQEEPRLQGAIHPHLATPVGKTLRNKSKQRPENKGK